MLVGGQLAEPWRPAVKQYALHIDARPCTSLLQDSADRDAMQGLSLPASVTITLHNGADVPGAATGIGLHASRACLDIRGVAALDDKGVPLAAGRVTWAWSPLSHTEDVIQVRWPAGATVAAVVVTYLLRVGVAPVGLYVSGRTPAHVWLATQCEPVGARRIMPCLDEPRAKAPVQVAVLAPPEWTVLGNTEGVLRRGHQWVFPATPPMSTYLLALVLASPGALLCDDTQVHVLPSTGMQVRVWRHPGDAPQDTAVAAAACMGAVQALEALTRLPYPLPTLDLVPVHAFDSAAMENWGCMLFHRRALLVPSPALAVASGLPVPSGSSVHAVRLTVAHEVAHQWFGNLVTMGWWNDLWLNEAFATLLGYWVLALQELVRVGPDQVLPPPPDALWAAALRAGHLPAWQRFLLEELGDALRGRAVDTPPEAVVTESDMEAMFDGVTYSRGAAVLRAVLLAAGGDAVPAVRLYLLKAMDRGGLASVQDLWDAVGPGPADMGGAWLRADRLQVLGPTAATVLPRLHPLTLRPVSATGPAASRAVFATPVTLNPLFGVPGLVPLTHASLPAFRALLALDVAGAICLLLSARDAVESRGDPVGWAIVREAAAPDGPGPGPARARVPPLIRQAATGLLQTWTAKCHAFKGSVGQDPGAWDARLRGVLAARAAASAHHVGDPKGKFDFRGVLQTVTRAAGPVLHVPAWQALLHSLASPTSTRKAILSETEAREALQELQRQAAALRYSCGPPHARPASGIPVAAGGRAQAGKKRHGHGSASSTKPHRPARLRRCCGAKKHVFSPAR
jgi:hypothetical protein